jgi:hypothetical protein
MLTISFTSECCNSPYRLCGMSLFVSKVIEFFKALETEKKFSLPPGFRIRIHLIRIQIQHFRLNTDPD